MGVWVVGLLGFLGDQVVFYVDFLGVGVGVVYFVGGVYDFVVLLVLLVGIFLGVVFVVGFVVVIGEFVLFFFEELQVVEQVIYFDFFIWFVLGVIMLIRGCCGLLLMDLIGIFCIFVCVLLLGGDDVVQVVGDEYVEGVFGVVGYVQ